MVLGAKAADMRAMSKIPSSEDGIAKRCKEAAGFVPYYLKKVQHGNARSAMAWAFLLRLLEGTEEVPATLKQVTGFVENYRFFTAGMFVCLLHLIRVP